MTLASRDRVLITPHRLTTLIARSRRNTERSRWLCERASVIVARSARLCRTPIAGASDTSDGSPDATNGTSDTTDASTLSASDGRPPSTTFQNSPRRSVLVLAYDPVMRAFIADAIRSEHDVAEAPDLPRAHEVMTGATRPDVIVAGYFRLDDPRAIAACASLARDLYDDYPWLPVVLVGDTPPPALKAELLLTAVRAFVSGDFTPADLAATVARVARPRGARVPGRDRVSAIKQTFVMLENTPANVPGLATLAATANMSRSHFSRTFHAVAGISLRDYVRDLRLKRAQHLMRATGLSLTAIATASGFYDLPHFNKAFRQRFGISPTQFRLASPASSSTLAS
jgi:AraC-like DNA-binding protein